MPEQIKAESSSTRIFVVSDHRLLRETLARLLRKNGDLSVLGHSSHHELPARPTDADSAAVVLSDFPFPLKDMSRLLANFRDIFPNASLLLFGMEDDDSVFLQAVGLGVKGYLPKTASSADLLYAVQLVARNEVACPPQFCKILFGNLSENWNSRTGLLPQHSTRFGLTIRQRQLMSLVARGLSNKEIAGHLNVSEFTVKNHIYRVMKRVDADSRHEAVDLLSAVQS